MTGNWLQAEGVKGGYAQSWYTAVGAGTRRGVQRRASEDDRLRVWETSRWTEHRTSRGVGYLVQDIGAKTTKATDGGGGR